MLIPFNPDAESVTIEEHGDYVCVFYQTEAYLGQKLTYAWAHNPYGKKEVYLDFYFIVNMATTCRGVDPVTVTWKIRKSHWEEWQKENTLLIRQKDYVLLSEEQVKIIKEEWE